MTRARGSRRRQLPTLARLLDAAGSAQRDGRKDVAQWLPPLCYRWLGKVARYRGTRDGLSCWLQQEPKSWVELVRGQHASEVDCWAAAIAHALAVRNRLPLPKWLRGRQTSCRQLSTLPLPGVVVAPRRRRPTPCARETRAQADERRARAQSVAIFARYGLSGSGRIPLVKFKPGRPRREWTPEQKCEFVARRVARWRQRRREQQAASDCAAPSEDRNARAPLR